MICLFTNLKLCGESKLLLKIREASLAGVDYIYLRENDLADKEYSSLALSAVQMMIGTRTELVVCHKDHIADKYNLKKHNRYLERTQKSFTVSVHTEEEAKDIEGCFFYSPIFETNCKPGVRSVGLNFSHKNLIALGGINKTKIKKLKHINHIGIMSEWLETEDVFQLIKFYKSYGY